MPAGGAPRTVPRPVTIMDGRHGTVYPNEFITATPGMFCDAIVTMYSGIAIPTIACHDHDGMVRSTRGIIAPTSRVLLSVVVRLMQITTAAVRNASGTAHRLRTVVPQARPR